MIAGYIVHHTAFDAVDEFKLFCDDERANDIEFTLFDDISLMGGPDGVLPSLADKASASLLDDTHDVS